MGGLPDQWPYESGSVKDTILPKRKMDTFSLYLLGFESECLHWFKTGLIGMV